MHAVMATIATFAFLAAGTADRAAIDARPALRRPPLMSAAKERELRKHLPRVSDQRIQVVLDDPQLVLYTEEEMPRAYQQWVGDLQGIHRADYNISANDSEPFGNGNREFPWSHPAGTHRSRGVSSFRFLWLPRDDEGRRLPVVWYRKQLRGDTTTGYAWTYPVGAMVGEVLILQGPDGRGYTFEMRLRIREIGAWGVDVFRPYPEAKDLAGRIKELRPEWSEDPDLLRSVKHLEEPARLRMHTLSDRQPGRKTFHQRMGLDVLPAIEDDGLVAELLTDTTFDSALGLNWRDGAGGMRTAAPTTLAGFHVVPPNYDAAFIEVDSVSCLRCHETVNQGVNEFDAGRDWYGRIRGSDGIFSFHPFALESISGNGYGSGVRMRAELESAGIIARYDRSRHPRSIYNAAEGLRE